MSLWDLGASHAEQSSDPTCDFPACCCCCFLGHFCVRTARLRIMRLANWSWPKFCKVFVDYTQGRDQLLWIVCYGSCNIHSMNKPHSMSCPQRIGSGHNQTHCTQRKSEPTIFEVVGNSACWSDMGYQWCFFWLITNQHPPIHFIINHFCVCMNVSNLNSSKHGFNRICDLPPHHFNNSTFCRLWAYRAGWVGRCWLSLSFSLPLPTWFIVGTSPGIR